MYGNGYNKNLAYNFELFDNTAKKRESAKVIKLNRKKINVQRFKNKFLMFTLAISASVLSAVAASSLIYGCVKNSETTSEFTKTKKCLEHEISRNISLKNQKESLNFLNSRVPESENSSQKIEYIINPAADKAEIY